MLTSDTSDIALASTTSFSDQGEGHSGGWGSNLGDRVCVGVGCVYVGGLPSHFGASSKERVISVWKSISPVLTLQKKINKK